MIKGLRKREGSKKWKRGSKGNGELWRKGEGRGRDGRIEQSVRNKMGR